MFLLKNLACKELINECADVWIGILKNTDYIIVLMVNHGISNTTVLEIPQFTRKSAISGHRLWHHRLCPGLDTNKPLKEHIGQMLSKLCMKHLGTTGKCYVFTPVASFTKVFNPPLAKRPLVFNGRLANRGLTSLVKEAT